MTASLFSNRASTAAFTPNFKISVAVDCISSTVKQGKATIQAPWIGFTGFVTISLMLSLLVFIGQAVRDAFDPRKSFK